MVGDINIIAVIIATIIYMAIGVVWYSGKVAGRQWRRALGKDFPKMTRGHIRRSYIISLISSFVVAYFLAIMIQLTGTATAFEGVILGIILWLGFTVAVVLPQYMFEGRKIKLFVINMSYHLVSFVILGAFLSLWQ